MIKRCCRQSRASEKFQIYGYEDQEDTSLSLGSDDVMNRYELFIGAIYGHRYEEAKKHVLLLKKYKFDKEKPIWITTKLNEEFQRSSLHVLCNQRVFGFKRQKKLMLEVASILLSLLSDSVFYLKNRSGGCNAFHLLFKEYESFPLCKSLIDLIIDHCSPRNILKDLLSVQQDMFGDTPLHYLAGNTTLDLRLYQKILIECSDLESRQLSFSKSSSLVVSNRTLDTPLHVFAASLHRDLSGKLVASDQCRFEQETALNHWIQYAPSAVVAYNTKNWLPIDSLIHHYVRNTYTGDDGEYIDSFASQREVTSSDTTIQHCPFYYCHHKRRRLTFEVEKEIYLHLWHCILILLKATYRLLAKERTPQQKQSSPPISFATKEEEISTMSGVHYAASCPHLPVIVLRCAILDDPDAISRKTCVEGKLPLHFAASSFQIKTKNKSSEKRRSEYNIETSRWCSSSNISFYPNSKISKNTCSHSLIQYLLELNKESAKSWTKYGQLPLHLACINGKSWADILLLLQAAPQTISSIDNPSRLYPFMLAGANDNNSVDVVFELLLFNPELVLKKT